MPNQKTTPLEEFRAAYYQLIEEEQPIEIHVVDPLKAEGLITQSRRYAKANNKTNSLTGAGRSQRNDRSNESSNAAKRNA